MLELRSYSKNELATIIGGSSKEALERKLQRWGVKYAIDGRGEDAVFTLVAFENAFKIYCITELGFGANTAFDKLKYLYYYFFNDDEFMSMPDEVKERITSDRDHYVSRQTIARYLQRLDNKGLIRRKSSNFKYYFAYKNKQIMTDISTYKKAWSEYFNNRANGMRWDEAICIMRHNYGGVARKQEIPDINGIFAKEIEYLNTLIQESIEADIEQLENK